MPRATTEEFANRCQEQLEKRGIEPTESDMLFVKGDNCLMSANYQLDGFAVTLGFEPIANDGCAPPAITKLLKALSEECFRLDGRIHLVKNIYAKETTFRRMFCPQIEHFEEIKRTYDPNLILQNSFSDKWFRFVLEGRRKNKSRGR
jgi:hypothetical protein